MRPNLLAVVISGMFLAGAHDASAALANHSVKAPSSAPMPNGDPSLYSQLDSASGNGVPDQDFETAYDAYDTDAADDFVVPAGPDNWSVTQVITTGAYTDGGIMGGPEGPASSVDITFFADNAGLPGAPVCSYSGLTPSTDNLGSFLIDLPTPCVLPPGTYWLGQQTNQDVLTAGQHFWLTRSTQSNSESVWRNPGDGFGTGCTDFTAQTACTGPDPDMLFAINGNLVAPPTLVPPAVIPVLSALGLLTLALAIGGMAWFRTRHSG